MQTEVTIREEEAIRTKPEPKIGQYWRHERGALYQIVSTGTGCLLANTETGLHFTASTGRKEVFSGDESLFTFIPSITITIN